MATETSISYIKTVIKYQNLLKCIQSTFLDLNLIKSSKAITFSDFLNSWEIK